MFDHDLPILDDDAYNFMEAHAPPSFAVLAPERGLGGPLAFWF